MKVLFDRAASVAAPLFVSSVIVSACTNEAPDTAPVEHSTQTDTNRELDEAILQRLADGPAHPSACLPAYPIGEGAPIENLVKLYPQMDPELSGTYNIVQDKATLLSALAINTEIAQPDDYVMACPDEELTGLSGNLSHVYLAWPAESS